MILEGIRLSVVINLGTATIGSTVAAKGLGEVIIAGLLSDNTAFVLQGGLVVGLMAVLLYDGMTAAEGRITRTPGPAAAPRGLISRAARRPPPASRRPRRPAAAAPRATRA